MKDFSDQYMSFLSDNFSGINLTKILDKNDFYHKQVLDSVLPLWRSDVFLQSLEKTRILLDVGFGAGFPLVPLSRYLPEIRCCGIEARAKKVEVVRQVGEYFSLQNLYLCHGRLEDFFIDESLTLTFKAVGKVADCLGKIRTDKTVRAFFYKGPRFHQLEDVRAIPEGWELIEECHFSLPGTEGRVFLGFRNVRPVGKKMGKSRKITDIFFTTPAFFGEKFDIATKLSLKDDLTMEKLPTR